MKRILALVLCLVLALSMALLAGCDKKDSDKESKDGESTAAAERDGIVGEWKGDFPLSALVGEESDESVTCYLTFEEDGAGVMSFDSDELFDAAVKSVEKEYGEDIEDILEEQGLTMEEWKADYEKYAEQLTNEFEWELDGETLYLDGDESGTFDGETLTLVDEDADLEVVFR